MAARKPTDIPATRPVRDRYGLYGVGHPAGGHLLNHPPDYEDLVWRRIAEAGATSVRQAASWREIEAEKGSYDWSQVEATLQYCRKYPWIRPYLLVVNTPGWARADGKPSHLPPVPEAIPDFKRFCRALAERYRGFVNHYEIWNEQNGFGWEAPPYNQFDRYLPVLKAGYEGLKEGSPECVVSLGGLDDAQGHSPIFTKGVYDLREAAYSGEVLWDAIGDHPYGDIESAVRKLRILKGIAAAYGDGDVEVWLTEYGFTLSEMSEEEQAAQLTAYMTRLIEDREFDYVTETNYLCIADFEESTTGFGLCDANLRPRPAFFAYQRLPRPGRIVISDIRAEFRSADSVEIVWRTDQDAACSIEVACPDGRLLDISGEPTEGGFYSAVVSGLQADSAYTYMIKAGAEGFPESRSLAYEFNTLPARGLANAGFEDGFAAGIARGWQCLGRNLCFDSARLDPPYDTAHSGGCAQAIVANGKWGDTLDDAAAAQAVVEPGAKCTFSVWTYAAAENGGQEITRRVGIDPAGGRDPKSENVVWSEPDTAAAVWRRQSVSAQAQTPIITVFAHARSGSPGSGRALFFVDDAELEC